MSQRIERVASLLQREIGRVLRQEIQNPDIGFVTILSVEVSKDLKYAKVFYSVMGDEAEIKKTDIAIQNSAKQIKKIVNQYVKLRYAVDLHFIRQDISHDFKIQEILNQIHKEKDNSSTEPTSE